jgi:glycosyltransferase involved in cell wall biosynthesis
MPVKLKEYLAAGLPVVATPLPELVRFAEEHKGLITLANSPQEFVAAIRAALGDNGDQALKNRILVARRYDWSLQMRRMSERIEQKLTSAKSEECEEHHRAFAAASTTSRW